MRRALVWLGVAVALGTSWYALALLRADREALLRRFGELVRRADGVEADAERLRARVRELAAAPAEPGDAPAGSGGRSASPVHLQAAELAFEAGRLAACVEHLEEVPEAERGFAWRLLRAGVERSFAPLVDEEDDVLALAAGPDGRSIAVGTRDGFVATWPLDGDAPDFEVAGHDEAVFAVGLSPSGARLASGDLAGEVRLWRRSDGEELAAFDLGETATALAFLDEDRVALGGDDGRLVVWNAATGDELELRGHDRAINALAVDRPRGRLASAGDDSVARVWSGAGLARMVELLGHADWVRDVAFDPAGRVVSTASSDLTVRHWDAEEGTLLATVSTGAVEALALARGTSGWCAVGREGELVLDRGGARVRLDVPLAHGVPVLNAVAGPDLEWLAVGMGAVVSVWHGASPPLFRRVATDAGELRGAAATVDGGRLYGAGAGGGVWCVDATGDLPGAPRVLVGHRGAAMCVALSRDGRTLVSGGRDGTARVRTLDDAGLPVGEPLVLRIDQKPVVAVAASPDGARIASASRTGLLRVHDRASGELVSELPAPQSGALAVTLHPDAGLLAWVGDGGAVRTWDTATGQRVHALRDRSLARVTGVALARDAPRLACVNNDYTAHVYDLATGATLAQLADPGHSIWSLALDPTGETLATGSRGGAIVLWDVATGARLLRLRGTFEAVLALAFTPDGEMLLAGTDGGALEVWEAPR